MVVTAVSLCTSESEAVADAELALRAMGFSWHSKAHDDGFTDWVLMIYGKTEGDHKTRGNVSAKQGVRMNAYVAFGDDDETEESERKRKKPKKK